MSAKVAIVAGAGGARGQATAAVLAADGRTMVAAGTSMRCVTSPVTASVLGGLAVGESPESGDGLLPVRR